MSWAKGIQVMTKSPRLRVSGLQGTTTVEDLKKFFTGYKLSTENNIAPIQMIVDASNRPTGHAFVYFKSEIDARKAVQELDRAYLPNSDRFVTLKTDYLQ